VLAGGDYLPGVVEDFNILVESVTILPPHMSPGEQPLLATKVGAKVDAKRQRRHLIFDRGLELLCFIV
jgi:hypothetical protein